MQDIQFPWDGEQIEMGPFAAAIAAAPNSAMIILNNNPLCVPAKFLKEFADAYRRVEDYARLGVKATMLNFKGVRNEANIKLVPFPIDADIVRVDLVPVGEYRIPVLLTKPELADMRWIAGVIVKLSKFETLAYQHTILVRNGFVVACDGKRAHVCRAPESQQWPDGVYTVRVQGENVLLAEADVKWSNKLAGYIEMAMSGYQFTITAGALRTGLWKQDAAVLTVQTLTGSFEFGVVSKNVLDGIKLAKDKEAIAFRVTAANEAIVFGTANRLTLAMPNSYVIANYYGTVGSRFPGADHHVRIAGTLDSDALQCVQITPMWMQPPNLLAPDIHSH